MGELTSAEATFRSYLRALRRRFLWIVVVAIIAVGASVAISTVQSKRYSASSQLLVQPAGSTSSLITGNQETLTPTDILTELQLLSSASVKKVAASQLGFEPSVVGSEVGQTNVISVTASASTPTVAARVANAYAKDFVSQQQTNAINELISGEQQYQTQIDTIDLEIQKLGSSTSPTATSTIAALASQVAELKGDEAQLQVAAAESPGGVELVSLASPPSTPSSPRPITYGAIALGVGILLGLCLALLVEYFDDKVYSKTELDSIAGGVPVLALIPKGKNWGGQDGAKLIAMVDPYSPITESYRSLRAALSLAGRDEAFTTILVTSPAGNEGKTSTVANLGVVLANTGKRVVVIGGDLRRPRLGNYLGLPETPGFTSMLVDRDDPTPEIQTFPKIPELSFIGSGPISPNGIELLGSSAAAKLFGFLSREFDVVLIDSPSLRVSDALVLSSYADALLLIVAASETTEKQVRRALQLLGQTPAIPSGIVLNKVTRRSRKR